MGVSFEDGFKGIWSKEDPTFWDQKDDLEVDRSRSKSIEVDRRRSVLLVLGVVQSPNGGETRSLILKLRSDLLADRQSPSPKHSMKAQTDTPIRSTR